MAAIQTTLTLLLVILMTVFGAGVAQEDQADVENDIFNVDEFEGFGEIRVGEPEPFDLTGDGEGAEVEEEDVETGAIVFTGETPGDQHPNIDLVGPDGYYNHFEVGDDPDEETVIDGLVPGVYSVAATDDGLQLAHTIVEVARGQVVRVNASLNRAAQDFVPGTFARDRTGVRAFPADGFRAGDPTRIGNAQFGQFTVETDDDDARFVVTGPDNYSREFSGQFTAEDLQPGVYVIAGSKEGSQIATTTVEIEAAVGASFVPAFVRVPVTAGTDGADGDVAGGGAADEADAETDEETVEVDVDTEESDEAETEAEGEDDN
jgi:hypothetical protein